MDQMPEMLVHGDADGGIPLAVLLRETGLARVLLRQGASFHKAQFVLMVTSKPIFNTGLIPGKHTYSSVVRNVLFG